MREMNLEQARFNMVEQQVRPWDVLDPRALDVMDRVLREHFVDPKHRNLAYSDLNLPLAHGQVMLSPRQEGRILQAVAPQETEQVLEIGTGSGYLTACLATLARHVTTVDIHPEFHELAGTRLEKEGLRNVTFVDGDAARGWDDGKRYDAIAVTGSLPELHQGFHRALTIGGRLFVIVGDGPIMEALLIIRVAEDQWAVDSLVDTHIPALINAHRTRHFEF
ncbi:protein-L-isoaspartate(D-aspartate) O-methyltransferase [Natronocella acetinitrilica]|jgi:protein-L-isoaspartate(D-aspartate) O-methyltransferase|uniref:Protein-L-isoaspartate O-methyltransferase n=1 Tax=Natronocella acetinitrilica TaxID=414046 RepID=A0AAE3G1U1_9GAMM|nr:protein-L-isoaspartate O-methyltransferase [Natronocella acetinitrilica]MCP1673166.1 protein-L-isoaspartate(D-aspartate) O-methyltransferase [Natronocella acetinitrilica]